MLIYINKKNELVIDGCDITIIDVPIDLGGHKSIFEWFLSGIHVNKSVVVTGIKFNYG